MTEKKSVRLVEPGVALPSIQGEQLIASGHAIWADQAEVDAYVAQASDEVLACRSRGRHTYEMLSKTERMRFEGVTPEGFLVRRILCGVCEKVFRVEEWDVRHRRDVVTAMFLVRAYPKYKKGYLGKSGQGRMRPRAIQSAAGTTAMRGVSFRQLRREAVENAKASA